MSKEYIFNIGLNRSGTTSLHNALEILNIPSLHYEYKTTSLEKIMKRNRKNNKKFFYGIDDSYIAFLDFAGEKYFEKLYFQYPTSKFILTTRPLDDWLNSLMYLVERDFPQRVKTESAKNRMLEDKKNLYIERIPKIRKFFEKKPEQFLEMNICDGDGWDKLCPFLNRPIPEIDFPWNNKSR